MMRRLVLVWTLVAVMLPFVLEWVGVLNPTHAVTGGVVVSASDIFDMRHSADEVALVAGNRSSSRPRSSRCI